MISHYSIGIDLGTTNCTMAYQDLHNPDASIQRFPILQWVDQGRCEELDSLPSFLYFLLEEEREKALPWDAKKPFFCVGRFAKERGIDVASRVIGSFKSWLSHPKVDRRSALLPLDHNDASLQKMSPLDVAYHLLDHMKQAWNHKMKQAPFDQQQIVITVPASFDPDARQLVEEAAHKAGYPKDVLLIEEPLAAFYSWLYDQKQQWRETLSIGDKVLVIDVGGGTTDFTLIEVKNNGGQLGLERIAVGHHLLLGGDNMDLALAHYMAAKFEEEGHDLTQWQMSQLVHQSRQAKEMLLSTDLNDYVFNIQSQGSRLFKGSMSMSVSKDEIQTLLVDGFFPLVGPKEQSQIDKQVGLRDKGLPYAKDPRLSCQLAKFLSMTGERQTSDIETFVQPTVVLLNGGIFKASCLKIRLESLLEHWSQSLKLPQVRFCDDGDLDFGVSRGASYYVQARLGKGIRVRSGISRNYFVGIQESIPAVPGMEAPVKAVCVALLGMEEGTESHVLNQTFTLVVGQPAVFQFFSNSHPQLMNGDVIELGTTVRHWKKDLMQLHPIEALLDKDVKEDEDYVEIQLKTCVTELGVLQLWCVAQDGRQWKLEFDVRHKEKID